MSKHPIQQLAALAHFGLSDDLKDHDGRTTLADRQCPITPRPGLGLEGYAKALGAIEGMAPLPPLREVVIVEVETPIGRREVPRGTNDGRTIPE